LSFFAPLRQGFSASTAAQRGNDDRVVIGLQTMARVRYAVPVDEETDMRADAIPFVNDPVAHSGIAGLEKLRQLRERLAGDNMFVKNADNSSSSRSAAAKLSNSQI
jgi:hypothetical protein